MNGGRADAPRIAAPVLLLAVVLAYAGALQGPFQFDDWWSIVGNADVHDLHSWWTSLPGIRPLLKLANTLNWLASPTPMAFHAVNIAVHAANVLLLWTLLRQWTPRLAPTSARPGFIAFATVLLFALHPAATEAVVYASGRSISLSMLFSLAALLAWSRAVGADASHMHAWSGALLLAAALAVRETALVTPVAWLLLARCGGLPWQRALAPLRPLCLVALLAVLAFALTPGYHSFFGWSLQTRDASSQLLGQLEAHAYLLTGPLPGLALSIDPDVRVPPAFALRHALLLAGVIAAVIVAWRMRDRHPWFPFALGWYLLQLAPANSFLPRFDLVNDRHLYAALPGPLFALAWWLESLRPRALGAVFAVALVLAAGARTVDRIGDYRSERALWEETVAESPAKARPWTNLGIARAEAGDTAGAAAAYRCALRLDPGYRQAAWNLAAASSPGATADRNCPAPVQR